MRFGAFPTLLFLFLATVGSQLKADFVLVSSEVAQCDIVSDENTVQQEMIVDIAETVEPIEEVKEKAENKSEENKSE